MNKKENLKLWLSGNYKKGKEEGKWTTYTFDGRIETEIQYESGKIVGETKYNYYPSGKLKCKKNYKKDKEEGTSTDYLENGQKIWEANFIDGVMNGQKTNWHNNGNIESEQEYKNGILHGKATYYFISGAKRKEEMFKNGELDGKSAQWFKNETASEKNSKEVKKDKTLEKNNLSNLSVFSTLKRTTKGSYCPIDIDKRFDEGTKEIWDSDYPTRTDVSNIENETDIVPIFGDSFMYGAGLPREYELGTMLRKEYPKVLFTNFGQFGAGNTGIVNRIEQWTNDEHSKKTKTIIVGFSSLYRFDYYIDSEYPESIDAVNSVHADVDYKMRTYDISPNWRLESHLASEKEKKTKKKLKKSLALAQEGIILSQTTYANVFLKNLEINIRRIDWITKQRKWNVIFVRNLSWDKPIHKEDMKVINQYFEDMDIKERQCKVIEMKEYQQWSNIIDVLDCGHWGPETMKSLIKEIKKRYDVL